MVTRRCVALTILFVWLMAPALEALVAVSADPRSGCDGHLCHCHARPTARPASSSGCHETDAPECAMSSRCHHDAGVAPAPGLRTDSIPAAKEEFWPYLRASRLAPAVTVHPETGHLRIDPYPPRVAS